MADYSPAPNVGHIFRVLNISTSWPAIVANGTALLSLTVPGIKPNDNATVTLGVGGTSLPTSVILSECSYCNNAGTLVLKLSNMGTLASAATATVLNVAVISGS